MCVICTCTWTELELVDRNKRAEIKRGDLGLWLERSMQQRSSSSSCHTEQELKLQSSSSYSTGATKLEHHHQWETTEWSLWSESHVLVHFSMSFSLFSSAPHTLAFSGTWVVQPVAAAVSVLAANLQKLLLKKISSKHLQQQLQRNYSILWTGWTQLSWHWMTSLEEKEQPLHQTALI